MDAGSGFKVFVVEDSPVIRTVLLQRIEEDARFSVVGYAETAPEAIGKIKESGAQLLIIDLHLREGSGYDILAHLKRTGTGSRLTSIVFTNYASQAHRLRAMALGATAFFDKSMEFDEMLDALRRWADSKASTSG